MTERVLLAWSSGKDSAFALHVLRRTEGVAVIGLLTTVDDALDRVPMHAVPRGLLQAQADAAGLPLLEARIPSPCPNEEYDRAMTAALAQARAGGATAVAFGDLFLEDVRRYREGRMAGSGLRTLFPLWGRPTRALAEEMIAAGQKAVLTSVDSRVLPASFAGRPFDRALLEDLPPAADPCGENGEFHTFVWDAPVFRQPVPVRVNAIATRDGFVHAHLSPAASAT